MRDKEIIHTTITKKAKNILEDIGGKGGMGDLITKLALQLDGGKMEQVVVSKHHSLPRPQDEIISINNDPITALQGGVFKNSITLIVGNAGTGKFSIIANMILELSLSQKSVLLVTPKAKDKVEKALKTIFIVKGKKVPPTEEAITLDLKITKPSILYYLAETLDKFVNKPILVLDHLEELVNFSPQGFNKSEWLFFNSCLRRNKITVIATASIDKEIIVSNTALGFDSIFYLTQSPVLMDGKSRLTRHIITFKSPRGTIDPAKFQLLENWQIKLDEKKSAFLAEKNTKNILQESGNPESLKKIASDSISSSKPDTLEDIKTEPPELEKPVVSRILAKDGTVLFDPEKSNKSADLEIEPVPDIKNPEPAINMEPKLLEVSKSAPIAPEPKKPVEKIEKTAEALIAKTGQRDASPAEIAMRIDLMKRSALNFPNAPNGRQVINQSAPLLIEVLLNNFTVESLRVFAEKYKGSGKYDELVAYITVSLPAILREEAQAG